MEPALGTTRQSKVICPLVVAVVVAVSLLATPAAGQLKTECQGCANADSLIRRFGLRADRTAMRDKPGWTQPRRIVSLALPPEYVEILRPVVTGVEVLIAGTEENAIPLLSEADAWIGPCFPELLPAAPNLRWIQLPSAGAEACADMPGLTERGITVTNMQSLYGPQIAETVMGMVLGFARGIPKYHREQLSGDWTVPISPTSVIESGLWELDGKVMLIIGLGGIGTEIAKRANALGMRVWATRNSSREGPDFVERVGLAPEALALAAAADVVVNAAPLTPDTKDMFNASFFRSMKQTAYFINVGRGASVVTADLESALRDGVIAGAGLDVTEPEPLPPNHALWSMPNVLLTPHAAAGSDYLMTRAVMLVMENARRFVAGDALLSVVNVQRGY